MKHWMLFEEENSDTYPEDREECFFYAWRTTETPGKGELVVYWGTFHYEMLGMSGEPIIGCPAKFNVNAHWFDAVCWISAPAPKLPYQLNKVLSGSIYDLFRRENEDLSR